MATITATELRDLGDEELVAQLASTKQELFTLPRGLFALYLNSQYQAAWTVMFAGIIIATIPTLVVFAVLQDRVTQGLTVGAL